MKMNAKKLSLMAFTVSVSMCAGQLAADTVATTGYNFGGTVLNSGFNDFKMGGIDVTVLDPNNGNAQVSLQNNGNGFQAGLFEWTTTDARFADGFFHSFCIEILQTAAAPVTFDVINLTDAPNPGTPVPGLNGMTDAQAIRIKQLWAANFDNLFDATLGIELGDDARERKIEAAAFQVAVWNIVYDTDNSVSTNAGTFYLRNVGSADELAMVALANDWLAELGTSGIGFDFTSQSNLLALSTPSGTATALRQDQVFQSPPGELFTPPVPSPVAAGMGLIGFAMLGLRRQREMV